MDNVLEECGEEKVRHQLQRKERPRALSVANGRLFLNIHFRQWHEVVFSWHASASLQVHCVEENDGPIV